MRGNEPSPQQRVVRRNRLFVLVPSIILAVLLAVLAWEIMRTNMSDAARQHLPWKVSFLGISSAASLSGVFAALLLARSQFARSVRPVIGWAAAWETPSQDKGGAGDDQTWVVKVHNGGPGLGIVRESQYKVEIAGADENHPGDDWITLDEALQRLRDAGLTPSEGVNLIQLGVGHPLVSSTKPKDGFEIFKLKERALPRLAALDMHLVVVDMVGDKHERYMQLLKGAKDELLPSRDPETGGQDAASEPGNNV
jgi:hypothetical protein